MTDSKKKRSSLLDNLAVTAAPTATQSGSTRALRAARNAVDGHTLWELDPDQIDTGGRIADRMDLSDLADLRDAIEANGQTVPILVRRDPENPERYLLVYGRRRLEAIRMSERVTKVRALVASLDDKAAIRAQVSENMARRDLTYIEKALFADELLAQGFGTQTDVAEVLTVTKSAVSMALAVVAMVTRDLAEAIGSAQGIGRPRWEALGKLIQETGSDPALLADLAVRAHDAHKVEILKGAPMAEPDSTVAAFNAVFETVSARKPPAPTAAKTPSQGGTQLRLSGAAGLKRTGAGLRVDVPKGDFADWFESQADTIFRELHDRWKSGG